MYITNLSDFFSNVIRFLGLLRNVVPNGSNYVTKVSSKHSFRDQLMSINRVESEVAMKTVQNIAAETAKTRDSKNKDICPVVKISDDTLKVLSRIHEEYPYDKSKVCQVILMNEQDKLIGILGYRISFVDKLTKKKYIKGGTE